MAYSKPSADFDKANLDDILTMVFGLALVSAFVLPLLSIWGEVFRLIAFVVIIWSHGQFKDSDNPIVGFAPVLFGLLYLIFLFFASSAFLAAPLHSFIESLRFVNGAPKPWQWSVLRLIVDIYLIQNLLRQAWGSARASGTLLVSIVLLCIAVTWVLPHIHLGLSAVEPLLQGSLPLADEFATRIETEMSGIAGWSVWLLTMLIGIKLLRNESRRQIILVCVFYAGVIGAVLILAQHAALDYSYVVDAEHWDDYLFRARGTYYYHGAATLFLTLAFFLSLGARTAFRSHVLHDVCLAIMALAIYVNSTRAIAVGMIVGAIALLVMRTTAKPRRREIAILLGLIALFVPEVFVIKTLQPSASPGTEIQQLAESNRPRTNLLSLGFETIWDNPVLGQGVGTARIEIGGPKFGGAATTDSSHTLPIDVALMAGLPVLLAVGMLIVLVSGSELRRWFLKEVDGARGAFTAGITACLAAFVITAMFFPRERNLTIVLIFVLIGLSCAPSLRSVAGPDWKSIHLRRYLHVGIVLIGVAGFGWSVMTSPTSIFPVAEFTARFLRDPLTPETGRVFVNSTRLEFLTSIALRLAGKGGWEAVLLDDDPEKLPRDQGWVLWDPSRDEAYSSIRRELGYYPNRGWGVSPSFIYPDEWQSLPSSQPVISIVQVGSRPYPPIPAGELGRIEVTMERAAARFLQLEETVATGDAEQAPRTVDCSAQWAFHPPDGREPGILGYELLIEGPDGPARIHSIGSDSAGNSVGRSTDTMIRDGNFSVREKVPADASLGFTFCIEAEGEIDDVKGWLYQEYMPDFARTAEIWQEDKSDFVVLTVSDNNHGSAWTAIGEGAALIIKPRRPVHRLSAYRLSGVNPRDYQSPSHLSWRLEGSDDGLDWHLVDRRANIELAHGRREFSTFLAQHPGTFVYYRFRFLQSDEDSDHVIGLAEIQLFAAGK